MLAERHDHDVAGLHDGADAHRDCRLRDVLLAEEIAGRVAPRDRIERDLRRTAASRRPRLIESDVSGTADTEDLNVDSARFADRHLVALAVVLNVFRPQSAIG